MGCLRQVIGAVIVLLAIVLGRKRYGAVPFGF